MRVRSKTAVPARRPRGVGRGRHTEDGGHRGQDTAGRSGQRRGGATQDRALYSCGCGYVFDAAVSTSVDCPHCGDTQAW